MSVAEVARQLPASAWRWIHWRNGAQPSRRARFAALRVTPARGWRVGRLPPDVWLLCERQTDGALKYYLVHLPAGTALQGAIHLCAGHADPDRPDLPDPDLLPLLHLRILAERSQDAVMARALAGAGSLPVNR